MRATLFTGRHNCESMINYCVLDRLVYQLAKTNEIDLTSSNQQNWTQMRTAPVIVLTFNSKCDIKFQASEFFWNRRGKLQKSSSHGNIDDLRTFTYLLLPLLYGCISIPGNTWNLMLVFGLVIWLVVVICVCHWMGLPG